MTDKTNLNWPIQLAIDLVKPHIETKLSNYSYLEMLHIQAALPLNLQQTLEFITIKLNDLNTWLLTSNDLVTDKLIDAWNVEDEIQREIEIEKIARKIQLAADALVKWEQSVAKVIPEPTTRPIFQNLFGITESLMKNLFQLFNDIEFVINHEEIHGAMEIRSPFQKPKKLNQIQHQLNELSVTKVNKPLAS